MTPEQIIASHHFWLTTIIAIVESLATVLVFVLAIWGEPIRAYLIGPRLLITLLDPKGERLTLKNGQDCRYYHLRVENKRRWSPAHNVRVLLTSLDRPAADGEVPGSRLSGPIQLKWQYGNVVPQSLTIGPAYNADLGCLAKNESFKLSMMIFPVNLESKIIGNETLHVEVIAVSDETESSPLRLRINWDGEWSDDAAEMARHFVVKQV
jgi:hypothetical protein